jgi:hypothetical protein
VQVYLACDAHRVPTCHGRIDVVGGHVQDVPVKARQEANDAGWTQEQHGTALLDGCPYCGIAYEEGIRGIGLQLPPREFRAPLGRSPNRLPEAPHHPTGYDGRSGSTSSAAPSSSRPRS